MNDLHIYLMKVSLGLAIICIPYYFLFRNDPNLTLKRLYLLTGLLVSWIFPLIAFRRPEILVNLTPTVFIDPFEAEILPVGISTSESSIGITINWIRVAIMVYLSGLAFMLIKNLWIILRWNLSWRKNRDENGIAFTGSDQVFTIFTRIFVPGSLKNEQDLDNILLHEKAHVQQLHFIDLTLMELTLLLTWFNPFSWLISRMIKENHEHQADRQVLSAGVNPAHYRAQLLNHTLGVNVFRLGNQFNHSLTLKRFKMMKKPAKSPLGVLKITMLIPAILITMGLATGMTPQQQKTITGRVVIAETGEAAPGAAIVVSSTYAGTVADLDGKFTLNVEGNPEIVISFVGFKTLRVKASEISKKPLKLKEEIYKMNLGSDPVQIKGETSAIAINASADSDAKPVYVVDGKVVEEVENIDPETIESISVFKDSDSEEVKKYNAPDGVILITTKEAAALAKKEAQKEREDIINSRGEIFYVVEDMPMFPGGKAELKTYIYSKLEYPVEMKKKGTNGEVLVQFTVPASGELMDIKAVSSSHKEFEAAAESVFEGMPKWSPGKQRGKPVMVKVVVPVRFNAEKNNPG